MSTEKKLVIQLDGGRRTKTIRASDIHFELDLGGGECTSKDSWECIHGAICAAALARPSKSAIVICRSFDKAQPELLSVFFRYLQDSDRPVCVRYFLITENPSAVPFPVKVRCHFISTRQPTSAQMKACGIVDRPRRSLELACGRALAGQVKLLREDGDILALRQALYNGLTRNLDCGWWIFHFLRELGPVDQRACLELVSQFYTAKSRGYRPIYHLERLAVALATKG